MVSLSIARASTALVGVVLLVAGVAASPAPQDDLMKQLAGGNPMVEKMLGSLQQQMMQLQQNVTKIFNAERDKVQSGQSNTRDATKNLINSISREVFTAEAALLRDAMEISQVPEEMAEEFKHHWTRDPMALAMTDFTDPRGVMKLALNVQKKFWVMGQWCWYKCGGMPEDCPKGSEWDGTAMLDRSNTCRLCMLECTACQTEAWVWIAHSPYATPEGEPEKEMDEPMPEAEADQMLGLQCSRFKFAQTDKEPFMAQLEALEGDMM